MGFKDKIMEKMMGNMNKKDKSAMMDKMMDNFFSDMTMEDKQDMMQKMFPKMMGGGEGMSPMMGMMQGMMGKNEDGSNPMDMCKKMMENISRSNQMAEYATPELRGLFEDWLQQINDEILQFVQKNGEIIPENISENFNLSIESINFLISKLVKDNRLNVTL